MIGALLGLVGKMTTLTSRLTSGRATNLDNLDAAMTSRAPSSTALSNVQWTNALATRLGAAGISQAQEFTATGAFTFNVPANVSLVWVTGVAAGASGAKNTGGGNAGGGGGGGEGIFRFPYKVTPGGTVSGSVGAAANAPTTSGIGLAGGDSIFGTITLQGGRAQASNPNNGAKGGGRVGLSGAEVSTATQNDGLILADHAIGGASGGFGTSAPSNGGACGRFAGGGGGGGGASFLGAGADGNNSTTPAQASRGAGGGGTQTGAAAGKAGDGYWLIEYVS